MTKFGSKGVGKLLGTGLTTKKAKVATQFGPSVGVGVYDAGKDAYDEFKSAMNQKQDEMDQGQGEQQKQSITPQQMAQLLSRKRNTGLVTPGTLQKFRESLEYTSQDITRCIIEANVKTKLVDLGTGKLTPVRYRPKGKGKPKGKKTGGVHRRITIEKNFGMQDLADHFSISIGQAKRIVYLK